MNDDKGASSKSADYSGVLGISVQNGSDILYIWLKWEIGFWVIYLSARIALHCRRNSGAWHSYHQKRYDQHISSQLFLKLEQQTFHYGVPTLAAARLVMRSHPANWGRATEKPPVSVSVPHHFFKTQDCPEHKVQKLSKKHHFLNTIFDTCSMSDSYFICIVQPLFALSSRSNKGSWNAEGLPTVNTIAFSAQLLQDQCGKPQNWRGRLSVSAVLPLRSFWTGKEFDLTLNQKHVISPASYFAGRLDEILTHLGTKPDLWSFHFGCQSRCWGNSKSIEVPSGGISLLRPHGFNVYVHIYIYII